MSMVFTYSSSDRFVGVDLQVVTEIHVIDFERRLVQDLEQIYNNN